MTKLAGEHLVRLYAHAYGLSTASLRFFTVYGPGQCPDMAFNRFIEAVRSGKPITSYGDGRQTRDFTFVDDIVDGVLAAGRQPKTPTGLSISAGAPRPADPGVLFLGELAGHPV